MRSVDVTDGICFAGLDVHARKTVAAAVQLGSGEVFRARLGGGAEGTIARLRSLPAPVRAVCEAKLYEHLGQDLNFNLLFSQCGHLTLAHTDRAMFVMANRAEVNRLNGIDSRLIASQL
jgi:hypothetical protein